MVVWRKRKKIEEMVVWNENENEKTPERAKMKRNEKWEIEGPQKGRIKKGVIPMVKASKVYPGKTSNGECIWVQTCILR